jgi:hypothetical protein
VPKKAFFQSTKSGIDAITGIYDFVWPTAAAVWNLRWQVAGYCSVRVAATKDELEARFVEGSGIHGANLRRACIEHSWDYQKAQLARAVLVNLIAAFEEWTISLPLEVAPELSEEARTQIGKQLQFPTDFIDGVASKGVRSAIARLRGDTSDAMRIDAQPTYLSQDVVHPQHIDALLVVYRLFKECRNHLMHGGGGVSPKVESAMALVDELSNSQLPFSVPSMPLTAELEKARIDLYAVVGFSDLLRRIMFTVDAELVDSATAERMVLERWAKVHGTRNINSVGEKRDNTLRRCLRAVGVLTSKSVANIEAVLTKAGLLVGVR